MNYQYDEAFIKAFGLKVKEARIAKGYSIRTLATEAGIEHSQVQRIENGTINTSIGTVFTLAKALDVPVYELFKLKV